VPAHLFVDISSHGFGHLAQTASVLNALRALLPELRLTIRSGLPHAQLILRLKGPFTHIPQASDFGLSMKNAIDVDVHDSLARYQAMHANWDALVQAYAQQLADIKPDLLLANVSYLALAAAREAHVPALAMCSLNWLDILTPYVSASPSQEKIQAQMLDAYNSAKAFLRLTPGMPMPHIKNKIVIGPIAIPGLAQPDLLRRHLNLTPATRLILVAMGGIPMPLPSTWPILPGYHWIVPQAAALPRNDMHTLESIALPFSDVLASSDAVVTKSAYGVFVEASVCGKPVLYIERPDWPEEPFLVEWLMLHNQAQGISRAQFMQGTFGTSLQALLQRPRSTASSLTGIDDAAQFIKIQLLQ